MKPEVKRSTWFPAAVVFMSACGTVSSRRSVLWQQARAGQGSPPIVSAPSPVPATVGKADLDQARVLLSRARDELKLQQWELLDRKLAEAEGAWQRFDALLKLDKKARASREAESFLGPGFVGVRATTGTFARVGATPALVALALLWPSSVAVDGRPPWLSAKIEYEAKLRELSEAAQQVRSEIEASKTPPAPPVAEKERPECKPVPVPHLGDDPIHDMCADVFPPNRFPGHDVLVNGKRFDALRANVRELWEIKTDRFDTYAPFVQERVIERQVEELKRERDIAKACGYKFVVGVSRTAHMKAILDRDRTLVVRVTGC